MGNPINDPRSSLPSATVNTNHTILDPRGSSRVPPVLSHLSALSNKPGCVDPSGGCWAFQKYNVLSDGGISGVRSFFQKTCSHVTFLNRWVKAGFENPFFEINPFLVEGNSGFDKFAGTLKTLDNDATLACVFHGSPSWNTKSILTEGLDPQRRRGQAFGPGEYFGKNPQVSARYGKGALEILVFVVVLPTNPKSDYYVVVENNNHQLPLGTVKYRSVRKDVIALSQNMACQLQALHNEVHYRSQLAKEASVKEKITQHVVQNKADIAAEVYSRNFTLLTVTSKREISWYVHQKIDEGIILFLFPDLPPPMSHQEFVTSQIPSVDKYVAMETSAREELDKKEARMVLASLE